MSYFIRIRGKAFGPFDENQLADMKTQGKLGKATEVSENKVDWTPAESLAFLYPSAPVNEPSASSSADPVYGTQTLPGTSQRETVDWYYSMNGTEGYGPVTATAIEQMIRLGQLNVNCYVWQQGQNARFIKNEPRFSGSGGGSTSRTPMEQEDMADIGGEITGFSEQVSTGKMILPLAASLGWLMFLKITCLIGLIAEGLYLLWSSVFWISHAIGSDNAMVLLVTLILCAFSVGLYALQFKTFLCFWKYHNDLYQVVATGRAAALIAANRSLTQLWKWLGITIIAYLSIVLVVATTIVILIGIGSGFLSHFQI